MRLQSFRTIASYSTMARDYNAAVAALNTLQSNFSIVDAIRKSGKGMNKNAIPEMIEWVRRIGYEVCVGLPLHLALSLIPRSHLISTS